MEVKHISSKDLVSIAKEHEYFLWHVLQKDYNRLTLYSYFKTYEHLIHHPIREILGLIPIPYFESYIDDEYEFIINLKDGFAKKLKKKNNKFTPILIGFHRTTPIISTYEGICYCADGMIEMIGIMNPKLLLNLD